VFIIKIIDIELSQIEYSINFLFDILINLDTDTDFSESEGLSSLQISGQAKNAYGQSADESGK
jgi:hypothetical protein